MSEILEVVTVVRKDHPDGKVDINKCDLTDKDVLWSDKPRKPEVKTTKQPKY